MTLTLNKTIAVVLVSGLLCLSSLAATPEIVIKGGTASLRQNIRQQLSIADEKCTAPAWRLNAHQEATETEISTAAQALGYYHLTYEMSLTRDKDCWGLKIQLTPNEPVHITEIRIDIMGEGRLDPLFQSIYDKPGLKVGQKLHHGKYENLKTRFENAATAHGYFDAQFALSRVLVNESEKTAVVEITYDTGKRYQLGQISISQDVLDENIVRRYLNIKSGEDYDTEKLLELKSLYNASNYFTGANIYPEIEQKHDETVDINIALDRRKRHEYSIGGGYATDSGPRVLLGYENRYLTKTGHFFNTDFGISTLKKEAEAVYTIPLKKPAFEFLKIFTGYLKEETDGRISRRRSVGTSYTYYQKNKWLQTYALTYEREDSIIPTELPIESDLLIPSWTISRTTTDGRPYPLEGWNVLNRISGSPKSLGSDFSYVQWYSRAKYIWGGDHGRLLLRGELGYTNTVDVDDLPLSVRYFAGGDASVRGYDYKSLGPENEEGEIVGGKHLWVGSIEYDHRIRQSNWVGAVFYDQGNSTNDKRIKLKESLGLGVRWISPIGPVRLDVARALDDEKSWAVHITMGPDL